MRKYLLLNYLIISLLGCFQAKAQITFTNFKVDNNSSVDVYIGSQVPTQTHQFSVTGRRLTNSNAFATIFVYLVDRYDVVATTDIAGPITTAGLWAPNPDGYDYCTVTGQFRLDDGIIQYGVFNKIRVIAQNTGSGSVGTTFNSNSVIINRITPPQPSITSLSPSTGPTTAPFTIAGNIAGNVTQVSFGGIILGTSLSTNVPTGVSPGSYPVTITTPYGTSNALNFIVTPSATTGPNVSLSPASGVRGSSIAISGTQSWYAYSNIVVTFNGVVIPHTQDTNSNQLRVTVPVNATLGTNTVVVTTNAGTGTASFNVVQSSPPTISDIFPNEAAEGSRVIISGAGMLNADRATVSSITINGISCPYILRTSADIRIKVPDGSYIGNTVGSLVVTTDHGAATFPFTVLPQGPADVLQLSPIHGKTDDVVHILTKIDWATHIARGYSMPIVTFNEIPATNVSLTDNNSSIVHTTGGNYYLVARVPLNLTTGLVKISNQFGTGSGQTYTADELQNYIPCGQSTVICSNQHVAYRSVPAMINGRVLADDNSYDFDRYTSLNGSSFANGREREWAQWQYSYTNSSNDWHDINGYATGPSFKPWDCYQTVYYRRVSSHIRSSFPNNYREPWYTSNVVTIIPYATINPGVYKIRNRYTGQLLEIGGGGGVTITQGTVASQSSDVGTANQQWEIAPTSDGMYKLINRNSRQALEIGGSNDPQPPGTQANQWPYWGGLKQQWMFVPVYNTNYFTITSANSGQELEIPYGTSQPGATVKQRLPNSGDAWSQWELVQVNVTSSAQFPGVYKIQNVSSSKVLEIGNAATNNGATAQQWDYANLASQEWTIAEETPGVYKITNRNSGLPLEIGGSAMNNGVVAQQGTYANAMNQQWLFDPVMNGTNDTYYIINYNTFYTAFGTYLQVNPGNISDYGAPVQQWEYTGGRNQQWVITRVSQNRVQQAGSSSEKLKNNARLMLYPNPASTVLNVALSNNASLTSVKVSDLRGATILETHNLEKGQINVSSLPAGTYMVTVYDGQQEYHQRFIKE